MSVALNGVGFTEELLRYVAANSGLGYVAEKTAFVGKSPDALGDSVTLLERDRQELTIYDSGGEIVRTSRRSTAIRQIRFVVRGRSPQDAVEQAWAVLNWLEDRERRHLSLTSFSVWNMKNVSIPSTQVSLEDGTSLANFVQEFSVQRKAT